MTNTTATVTYSVGDRVSVATAATEHEAATGTITAISKGWYVVELDEPEDFPLAKNGIVSARVSSLTPATDEEGDDWESEGLTEGMLDAMLEARESLGSDDDEGDDEGDGDEGDDEGDLDALDAALTVAQQMAAALRKARVRYKKTKRPMGGNSADNDDQIAQELRDLEPLEVAGLADKVLGVATGTHRAKYGHLNNGQIRMNSGNRIRGYWKKLNAEPNPDAQRLIEVERVAKLLNLVNDDADE